MIIEHLMKLDIILKIVGCTVTKRLYHNKDYHIVQSMDGKSRWADNIMIERWFRSLKVEEIYPNEYANPRELRRAIARYINEYNTLRPHGALDNRTPASVYYASFSSGASEEMELAS